MLTLTSLFTKFSLLCLLVLTSCSSKNSSPVTLFPDMPTQTNKAFDFREITQEDLEGVKTVWQNRNLEVQNTNLVYEEIGDKKTIQIYSHTVNKKNHYGAIVIPNQLENPPVAILLSGLRQFDKHISLQFFLDNHPEFENFIWLIPTFRGQVLQYKGMDFAADGDFCDAYDGATDDTIAFINVAQSTEVTGQFDSILSWGGSRGGNVSLLLAVRDPRIHTALAAAAPVDFYRNSVRQAYGSQYRCQYLDGFDEQESRTRMLASSPLHFEPLENVKSIALFHGANDPVVPRWNFDEMKQHLSNFDLSLQANIYEGENHNSFYSKGTHKALFISAIENYINELN